MPTRTMGDRPSLYERTPGLRRSVELARRTMLPPKRESRWKRMAVAATVLIGLGVLAYFVTESIGWALLLLVVGVPVVVLPAVLIIGMIMEAREEAAAR